MFFDIDRAVTPEKKTFKEDPLGVLKAIIGELKTLGKKHPEVIAGLSAVANQEMFEEVVSANGFANEFKLVKGDQEVCLDMDDLDLHWSPYCPARSVIFISRPRHDLVRFVAVLTPMSQ